MRATLVVLLCCLVILVVVGAAWSQGEQDAIGAVREFGRALTDGDVERAVALTTEESFFFLCSAISIAPPVGFKEQVEPMFFGEEITEAEAQALRGVLDAMVLARARRIEMGEPVRTAKGLEVPVTVELTMKVPVTERNGAFLVDLARAYPAAREMADEAIAKSRKGGCISNLRQLTMAVLIYADDGDGRLPNAATWMDDIRPYIKAEALYHCPTDEQHQYGYAFNSELSGVNLKDIEDAANTVLLFESTSGRWNAADPVTSLPDPPRHGDGNNFAYADGHATFIVGAARQ